MSRRLTALTLLGLVCVCSALGCTLTESGLDLLPNMPNTLEQWIGQIPYIGPWLLNLLGAAG